MTKQIRLGIDCDGVLADFIHSYKNLINEICGDSVHLNDEWQPHLWSFVDCGVLTKEQDELVWQEIMRRDDFWLGMRPYIENVNALEGFLSRIQYASVPVSIFYITSRVTSSGMSVLKQTRLWLESFQLHRYNTAILPVVHSNNSGGLPPKKALVDILGLDAMIDDYAPTVVSLGEKGWLLDRPWNRAEQNSRTFSSQLQVVNSLEEFLDKFEPARAKTALPI
jgi:hypothetical protein